jgi:hypothetical protein
MKKDELIQMAANPQFIPGIYNYCDRWCERCQFTARCLNYSSREKHSSTLSGDPNLRTQEFLDGLRETFQATIEILNDMARECGIDLENVKEEARKESENPVRRKIPDHELTRLGREYMDMVDAWMHQNGHLFGDSNEDEDATPEDLEMMGRFTVEEPGSVRDCVDIIGWYQDQIYVKLATVLREMGEADVQEEGGFDPNGWVKVSLLGMDRSLDAWTGLCRHFPSLSDDILNICLKLSDLRRKTESDFPGARAFIRPGFDTGE